MSDQTSQVENRESNTLFYIEKLSCAYGNNPPVLEANNINIPRGKITVLLGPSGAGKSTLLETLGLMTQTVNPETSSIIFTPTENDEFNLADIWGEQQEAQRYDIRLKYYSFIFQSTNLMPNFTALENVGLTELIQNKPESEAYFNAIESLVKNLSVTSLSYTKKPFEFSGGERQRLAFARAINPEFTVLFGDEPTGNLDHFNSVKLMHFIREFITKQRTNVSVIIVSHNIPLTLDFADRIIVLSKKSSGVSTIDPHFVFDRDQLQWDTSKQKQSEIQKDIELLLNSDTESYVRILTHLSENSVEEPFFYEIKESMSKYHNLLENDPLYPEEKKIEYQNWLEGKLGEKELTSAPIKEYIRQFAFGERKKADIKINDVIRTIQDLKFKTAVEGQRDKSKSHSNAIEDQELGGKSMNWAAILGFFPWLAFSIAPWITFLSEKTHEFLLKYWGKVTKGGKKGIESDETDYQSMIRFKLADVIPSLFYQLCIAWDWINVKFKLFGIYKLKLSWIQFNTIPHDFKHLFYRNESKALLGKKNKNFWLIVIILAFTFLAIGFSNGSLKYLKDKMEDPFVRSLNAPISISNKGIMEIIDIYNTDSLQAKYNYDSIVGYNKQAMSFQGDLPDAVNRMLEGRSIPYDDALVSTIVNPSINLVAGNRFVSETDYSMIVTRTMLEKIGSSPNPAFLYRRVGNLGDERLVPIPVRAVVEKLPGDRVEFLVTQHYFNNYNMLGDRFLFADNKKMYAFIVLDSAFVDQFTDLSTSFFDQYQTEGGFLEVSDVDVYKHQYSYTSLYYLQVSFYNTENISLSDIDELFQQFRQSTEIVEFMKKAKVEEHELVQAYYPNQESRASNRRIDYIAINFNDLSKVDQFAEQFSADSGVKLEMAKLEQMKNYNFVSKLTRIMSIILIGFSVLMINIFLSNILSTHLNKIKMNIGTFKAFGIDIKRIYLGMMYIFVLLPLLVSLIIAGILGYLGSVYFLIKLLSPFPIERNLYFDLFDSYTLISIIVLVVVNYMAFSIIINKIFRMSPGDLIYDRSNKA